MWLRLLVAVGLLATAVIEYRRRVAVDADGVHIVEVSRRRTYPWADIGEVQPGRPTLLGDVYVYLQRHDDDRVELPSSGSHLDLLRSWHTAMSR